MTRSPETIHQRGRDAVLAGRAVLDVPPVPGGTRWGLSLVARPDPGAAEQLQGMAAEAVAHAGPGQWVTASPGSTHLTVTYLEGVHRDIGPDDEAVRRFADAVGRLAVAGVPRVCGPWSAHQAAGHREPLLTHSACDVVRMRSRAELSTVTANSV